ncbi:hypothetical protein Nepgr_016618 [Nepenthes gracilis]|uniref:EF-hand domain-containing protein n=1 Tax=Nepenthes gracilis TaxID=150966 RepID=A0AAD3SQS0_NEPGR|nr:hypothetical protein Nepgr_016618 [Nepenthes gracilis]
MIARPDIMSRRMKMSKPSFFSFHRETSRNSIHKPPSPPPPPPRLSSNKGSTGNSSSNPPTFQPSKSEMKAVFDRYDANGDGKISREEYKAVLRAVRRGNVSEREVAKAFEVADTDGDGFIDFNEFMEVHRACGGVKVSEVQSAFHVFDLDGDGKISAAELREVMRRIGESSSLEACQKMVRGADRDGDGFIDMDEFTAMMTRGMNLVV